MSGWTPEEIATLTRLWGEGRTAAAITAHLPGRTRNSIIGRAHRLGLASRPSPLHGQGGRKRLAITAVHAPRQRAPSIPTDWEPAAIGLLKLLWSEGHSAKVIAERIKALTHGAICISRGAVIGKAHRLRLGARPSPIKRPGPSGAGAPGCRFPMWPHDSQPTGEFCGQPIERRSYCAKHYALTHTTSRAPLEVAA